MRVLLTEEEKKARKNARNRAWRAANPEKARAWIRAWRAANLEKARAQVRARNRAWRAANLDKLRAQQRVRMRAWRAANLEKARALEAATSATTPSGPGGVVVTRDEALSYEEKALECVGAIVESILAMRVASLKPAGLSPWAVRAETLAAADEVEIKLAVRSDR